MQCLHKQPADSQAVNGGVREELIGADLDFIAAERSEGYRAIGLE